MMEVLKRLGVDWRDRRMISNLYLEMTATVRIGSDCSEASLIGRGVRQRCCLSPLLFTVYAEMLMVEAMEGIVEGLKVGGKWLKDVRFADDQAMVASSELALQTIIDSLVRVAKQYDVKINAKKTKIMKVLKGLGVDWRVRRMISNINLEMMATVRIESDCSKASLIGRGVRQGCCLSPLLFTV